MTFDASTVFVLFLMVAVSAMCGYLYWIKNQPPVESEDNSLGEYINCPVYSQGILDFYRKTIQEWVVIKFKGWENTHKLDFSNRDHFKKLTAEILIDFFEQYSLQKNVKFEYCLFTQEYLINFISMVAMETMQTMVETTRQHMEEVK